METGVTFVLAHFLVSLELAEMRDTASIGLVHTISMWNTAHAGKIIICTLAYNKKFHGCFCVFRSKDGCNSSNKISVLSWTMLILPTIAHFVFRKQISNL